jgi:Retrotransposon gag protein
MDHDAHTWPDLVKLIKRHFQRLGTRNGMEEPKELHQTGSIDDYIELFERLRFKLLLKNRLFTEIDFMDAFVGGLKPEIKAFVKAFQPQTLDATFTYACHMECAIDTQLRRLKAMSKPVLPNIPSKTAPIQTNTRNALMEQRRALGQCFKCGDKYFLGHQCKIKVHMLLGQEVNEGDTLPQLEFTTDIDGTVLMVTDSQCSALQFSLQGQQFTGDLR